MSIKTDSQVKLNDGRAVGYAEYGDLTGKPVVHLHGTPSSRLELNNPDLVEIAERLHIRLIVPDRPGIGLSDWKRYTIADYPDLLLQFADKLGLDRFPLLRERRHLMDSQAPGRISSLGTIRTFLKVGT